MKKPKMIKWCSFVSDAKNRDYAKLIKFSDDNDYYLEIGELLNNIQYAAVCKNSAQVRRLAKFLLKAAKFMESKETP